MSTVAVNIGCTTFYTVSLCYGSSCYDACDCTSPSTYYSTCGSGSLNVGCQLFTSNGTNAAIGYYSDGTYCYEYGIDSEISEITAKSACTSSFCYCMGFSSVDCSTACSNKTYCPTPTPTPTPGGSTPTPTPTGTVYCYSAERYTCVGVTCTFNSYTCVESDITLTIGRYYLHIDGNIYYITGTATCDACALLYNADIVGNLATCNTLCSI